MKFTLRNLGRLEEATLDLGHDLILLSGRNNTSKTYVAHAIYGFFRYLEEYLNDFIVRKALSSQEVIRRAGSADFIEEFIRWVPEPYHTSLIDIFAAPDDFVDAVQSQIEFTTDERNVGERRLATEMDDVESFLAEFIQAADENASEMQRRQYLIELIAGAYFGVCARPFILTAERAAIQLFSRELSLKRSDLVDRALRARSLSVLEKGAQRYPVAIRDSLRIMDDLAVRVKRFSECSPLTLKLEALLEGRIHVDEAGEMTFRPAGAPGGLVMHLSSSSVKSLSGLVFYLRHIARRGDFLIIDEPEMNLHPDNQRKIARMLARISNAGIKVMVSTHSDYVIREINNLIMLNADQAGELRRRYGYEVEETLRPAQVGAYLFTPTRAQSIPVQPFGIEVESIDKEINELNVAARDIYYSLVNK